jgi:hypothetical protein
MEMDAEMQTINSVGKRKRIDESITDETQIIVDSQHVWIGLPLNLTKGISHVLHAF